MGFSSKIRVGLFLLIFITACVESYDPPEVSNAPSLLVVDGFLNATKGSAKVTISTTVPLNSQATPPPVNGATVFIESDQGEQFSLFETTSGVYTVDGMPISVTKKYRLKISSFSGNYESDFVSIEQAAPIESVSYKPESENLVVMVNSAQSDTKSKFYRWTYDETWEYNSAYPSTFIIENGAARLRTRDEMSYVCYRTDPSSAVLIGSTQDLSSNVVRNFELTAIPRSSFKITRLYSINVKQFALTDDAYAYWLNIYKTTENVGGLFDPMPGQVPGNIRSVTNPKEFVVGFFSASTVSEKRIFINPLELPEDYVTYQRPFCQIDTIPVADIPTTPETRLLVDPIYATGFPVIIAYTTTSEYCIDCRIYGKGTTTKPEFWP